jgi:Ser/Thr protein kinase RdoA (MazF antagonist)
MKNNPEDLIDIARQFTSNGVIAVEPFGSGNINDTFLVKLDSGIQFVLQRLNTHVFKRPELVMQNMRAVTEHIHSKLQDKSLEGGRQWKNPLVITSNDGKDYWIDREGSFWRAITFIEGARTFNTIKSLTHAEEVGFALGTFHNLISDLPSRILFDTLEGFHITPLYLSKYDIAPIGKYKRTLETQFCIEFIERQRALAAVLEDAKAHGKLALRIMHGDPKINNVLMDDSTKQAVCMIDLDTVKPGLVHYDIGDCLRSACNPLGEEVEDWRTIRFEPDICEAILSGYLSQARCFFSDNDYAYIFDSVRLISFELGLRFFTDYLEGDIYFKTRYTGHNLMRALIQFRLCESVEEQQDIITTIIAKLRT